MRPAIRAVLQSSRLLASPVTLPSFRLSRPSSVRCMATASTPPVKYHMLEYKYVSDILERRGPFRAAHIAGAKAQAEAGKLVFGGAYNPNTTDVGVVEGALFIFKDATPADIEAFVAADPYVVGGLVPSWSIKPYNVVVEPN
ncbi:MAG: hypothetical protein WDW36_006038 [Sanguina aurantia]